MNDLSYGPLREPVDAKELEELAKVGAVFLDPRRSRPLWFDGRFLTARDLNREQNYFLVRQADLATATGSGVIEGLQVEKLGQGEGALASRIVVRRGHGVTVGGERVVIDRDLEIDLGDVPLIQRLNVVLGLSREPAPSLRTRTGLFVVVLRALEFSANPIASYPTHVDAARSVEDGEIIEATAISLIPYGLSLGVETPQLRQAAAAYRIFAGGAGYAPPPSSLPLAMVELERGMVRWVDNHLVRREMGSSHSDVLGFGLAARPQREAFLRHYLDMLDAVIAERQRGGAALRFAAGEQFLALPAAGRLPAAAIDTVTCTQHFFPSVMDVELSFIPQDEIPLLLEESMVLPPIDLTAPEEVLEATSVLVLVPVERHRLPSVTGSLPLEPIELAAPVSAKGSRLRPAEMLDVVRARLPGYVKSLPRTTVPLLTAIMREHVEAATLLWYVRRRNLSHKASITGEALRISPVGEAALEKGVVERLKRAGVESAYENLKIKGSLAGNLAMARFLSSERFTSDAMLVRAVRDLEKSETLDEGSVMKVVEGYTAPETGNGLAKLEAVMKATVAEGGAASTAEDTKSAGMIGMIADSQTVKELDTLSRRLPPEELRILAADLRKVMDTPESSAEALKAVIEDRRRRVTP